jgi:hypothetical protein
MLCSVRFREEKSVRLVPVSRFNLDSAIDPLRDGEGPLIEDGPENLNARRPKSLHRVTSRFAVGRARFENYDDAVAQFA